MREMIRKEEKSEGIMYKNINISFFIILIKKLKLNFYLIKFSTYNLLLKNLNRYIKCI